MDRNKQYCKAIILSKMFCRFNAIAIKILIVYFVELANLILKFMWKINGLRITKTLLRQRKNKIRGICSSGYWLNYRVI